MINVQLAKWERGHALSDAGTTFFGPWDDSPGYPAAAEQAPSIVLTRITPLIVRLQFGPAAPLPATCDIWIDVTVEVSQQVDHYIIDWGDSTSEVKPGHSLKQMHFQVRKVGLLSTGTVSVQAYTVDNILIESATLSPTWVLESRWRVHQYRIERFKGRDNYAEQGKRWLQDWSELPPAASTYIEIEATERWNWGFRLWLREIDSQGRPSLTMLPSDWASTGTGEGSVPLPVGMGWGSEWGSEWGST